jgi:hypothetical protein
MATCTQVPAWMKVSATWDVLACIRVRTVDQKYLSSEHVPQHMQPCFATVCMRGITVPSMQHKRLHTDVQNLQRVD